MNLDELAQVSETMIEVTNRDVVAKVQLARARTSALLRDAATWLGITLFWFFALGGGVLALAFSAAGLVLLFFTARKFLAAAKTFSLVAEELHRLKLAGYQDPLAEFNRLGGIPSYAERLLRQGGDLTEDDKAKIAKFRQDNPGL